MGFRVYCLECGKPTVAALIYCLWCGKPHGVEQTVSAESDDVDNHDFPCGCGG